MATVTTREDRFTEGPLQRPDPLHPDKPAKYHPDQLVAHWTIVGLVAFQILTGPTMEDTYLASLALEEWVADGTSYVHMTIGLSILAVMIWRVALRRRFGAPPKPDDLPVWLANVSHWNHYAFYVLLIAMPLFGLAAVVTVSWAPLGGLLGFVHGWAAWLLLALIALHVAGASFHAFVKRDGVQKRMMQADPAGRSSAPLDPGSSSAP